MQSIVLFSILTTLYPAPEDLKSSISWTLSGTTHFRKWFWLESSIWSIVIRACMIVLLNLQQNITSKPCSCLAQMWLMYRTHFGMMFAVTCNKCVRAASVHIMNISATPILFQLKFLYFHSIFSSYAPNKIWWRAFHFIEPLLLKALGPRSIQFSGRYFFFWRELNFPHNLRTKFQYTLGQLVKLGYYNSHEDDTTGTLDVNCIWRPGRDIYLKSSAYIGKSYTNSPLGDKFDNLGGNGFAGCNVIWSLYWGTKIGILHLLQEKGPSFLSYCIHAIHSRSRQSCHWHRYLCKACKDSSVPHTAHRFCAHSRYRRFAIAFLQEYAHNIIGGWILR